MVDIAVQSYLADTPLGKATATIVPSEVTPGTDAYIDEVTE